MNNTHIPLEQLILQRKSTFFFVDSNSLRCIVNNLKFLYYSVIASENLLALAIEQLGRNSTFADEPLIDYFNKHLQEERDHCRWLADDLMAHGVALDGYDENAIAMIGSQYYMIFHIHPSALLGYLAVVEGTPTPIKEVEKLERVYGKKLFRFLRFHSVKDQEHKTEVFQQINKLSLDHANGVLLSANITLNHICNAAKTWH